MIEKNVVVQAEEGLHARPAGIFAKKAAGYKSNITIKAAKGTVNAKSIMSIMSLGIEKGANVLIIATGEDEAAAVEGLAALL
jgi:phosphocarrier protein HPr